MSTDYTADESIDSDEAFEAALIELVQSAQANGIDPAGFYESLNPNGAADLEIEVIELTDEASSQ
ncbi:MAG: hypothetical protein ABEH64_06185 [Salinirussus sp.]